MSFGNLCRGLMMLALLALFVAVPTYASGPSIDPDGITGDNGGGSTGDVGGSIDPDG